MDNHYKPSDSVVEYLKYLEKLEQDDPHLISAYIYHLYVGLFSGGQILSRKRALEAKLKFRSTGDQKGEAVTKFGDIPIAKLKKQMMEAMESFAEQLGDEDREKLIEESKNVFRNNNRMIKSIKGTNQVVVKKLFGLLMFAIPTILAVYFGGRIILHSP